MRSTLMNIAIFLAMTLFMASCLADAASAKTAVQKNAAGSATYSVPQNGTPAQYLAFIEKLSNVKRPDNQTRKEAVEYFTKMCKAQIAAANKVIEHKDADSEQIRRAASVKVKSLQILIKLGSEKAKAMLEALPAELKKANQPKIADDIFMGLINLKFQDAQKTNDFSEIEKIIAQTTEAIKKTPADDKNKLQRLYRIKLICIKELGKLKGEDNSTAFDAVVAEIKAAGLMELHDDVILSQYVNALADATARKDKALFDKIAKLVDTVITRYGTKANSKIAALAFRTAYAEEVFDSAAAAVRYAKYAKYFAGFKDAKIQEIVKKMQGAARRLALKGKPLPITGKTVDGKKFNMANLKNKNVLVFPWSSSDPASVQKLNYLRRAYPAYKAKGFDVVGVAMDRSPQKAAAIARQYQLPWANMSYRNAFVGDLPFWLHYGFSDLSRMIMLNRQGLVSSANLNYRSLVNELDREYGKLTKEQIDAFKDIDVDKFLKDYDEYDFDKYLDDYDYDYLDDDYDFLDD
ncbi:MAG: TlpA disulfide reductase family protein, partial [Thermoguttaceae bacterium]|nr:TlpA disulfide reductase family protein [Thermoguttaceae bacterium]